MHDSLACNSFAVAAIAAQSCLDQCITPHQNPCYLQKGCTLTIEIRLASLLLKHQCLKAVDGCKAPHPAMCTAEGRWRMHLAIPDESELFFPAWQRSALMGQEIKGPQAIIYMYRAASSLMGIPAVMMTFEKVFPTICSHKPCPSANQAVHLANNAWL